MVEDTKKDEEKEVKQKREEEKPTWFQRVPAIYKIGVGAIIFIRFLSIAQEGGNISQLWIWIAAGLGILYFIGQEGKKLTPEILTPEEAEKSLEIEIKRKIRTSQIPRGVQYYIGPNNGLFHHEGMPMHYIIEVALTSDDLGRDHKRGIVFAEGNTKGYATLQDNPGKITGREAIPIISPIPNWIKRGKAVGLEVEKFLGLGGGKK